MIKFLNEFQKFVFGPFFVHFPSFWGKKRFSRKSGSATIFLAPCQTLEKPNYTIQMPGQTEGWTEGWMEERFLFRTLLAAAGAPKSADHVKCSNMSSPISICLL